MVETGDGTGSGGGPTPVRVSELVGTFVADEFGPPVFTPDTNLYQGARILVPVDLQALVVEEEDAPLSRQEVSSQPSTDPSEFEPASPFTDGTPLGAGIHLHWAMPDALMKGRAGDLVSDPVSAPHTESPDGPQLRTSEAQVNHSAAEVTHLQPDSEILSAARSGEELPVDSGEEKLSEMFNFLSLPDRWVAVSYTHLTLPTKA